MDLVTNLLIATLAAGTPILLAALGGILSERSGIIHLGPEGLMLIGAVISCLTYLHTGGNLLLALLAAILATGLLGLVLALLTVTLTANQIICGLAIGVFGTGFSTFLGKPVVGIPMPGAVPKINLPFLEVIPVIGGVFAHLDVLIWFSFLLVIIMHLYIHHTSWGLRLKATGESPMTADSLGIRIFSGRYAYVIVGSMLMGLAGAYLILAYTPSWREGMTAGRGWIAVALIIFSRWNPIRALICAYLFGGLDSLGFNLQIWQSPISPHFLKMLPYIITIIVLIVEGWRNKGKPDGGPASLGLPYVREQRH